MKKPSISETNFKYADCDFVGGENELTMEVCNGKYQYEIFECRTCGFTGKA